MIDRQPRHDKGIAATMQKLTRMILIFALSSTAACSSMRFPGVFRIDIPQGNIISPENVEKLKLGMTSRQVEYVMGSPMLQDPFHPNRWDYLYHLETGKGVLLKNHLTLYFENDTLVKVDKSHYKDSRELNSAVEKQLKIDADLQKGRKQLPTADDAIPRK